MPIVRDTINDKPATGRNKLSQSNFFIGNRTKGKLIFGDYFIPLQNIHIKLAYVYCTVLQDYNISPSSFNNYSLAYVCISLECKIITNSIAV